MIARRSVLTAVLLGAAALILALVSVPTAEGGYRAGITNSTNSAGTRPFFTCTNAATALGATVAWPLDDAYAGLNTQAQDVSGNANPGTYSNTGVAFRQGVPACPRDLTATLNSPNGTILDGLTGYVSNTKAFPQTSTFTEAVWFRTSTRTGGSLIGFANSAGLAPSQYDRMVWMTNAGNLVFGVCPASGCYRTVTSPLAYNDNTFHLVVASLGPSGMYLYVDGVQVAVDTTSTTAQTYSTSGMYLRVGYDNQATWAAASTSYFFGGTVRFATYFTTQLTQSQVTALYSAGI